MKENLLTKEQRVALDRLMAAGGVAFSNPKKNGFDQFRSVDALALLLAGAAEIQSGELRLSRLGRMLTGEIPTSGCNPGAQKYLTDRGQEYS